MQALTFERLGMNALPARLADKDSSADTAVSHVFSTGWLPATVVL
ncbi:hypothetical protein GCM10009690_03330 [Brevibacterium permense]|uniref:Uncharacterized protein n=1 Tax=Brevibacterium permense TaxID=234834 RepID=A0ABN1ZTE8_9MICO